MKIKDYLSRSSLESLSILLSSICIYSAYEIRNAILQLNSIDDTLIVIDESIRNNLSLNHCIYLRLRGRDEEKINNV